MVADVLEKGKRVFQKNKLKEVPEAASFKNDVNTITLF